MIQQNISDLKKELGASKLVVVSKYRSLEELQEVYNTGHRLFGENRVQELRNKQAEMPDDIEWHMIGHLQKNKVKYIAPYISLIHSVDSLALLSEINKQAARYDRTIEVLLQIHIAQEDTKFGLSPEEAIELLQTNELGGLSNIRIVGLMGMATNTSNTDQVRSEFESLKSLFDKIQANFNNEQIQMRELSMGMSGDYKIAVECGSSMVRVGSLVFS